MALASSSSTSSLSTQENMPKKMYQKGRRLLRKRIPPPPDDDSEGSDIEVSQSNPAKKKKQYSKPKHPTLAVSDKNKSDDARPSHFTSNILPSLKPKYKTAIFLPGNTMSSLSNLSLSSVQLNTPASDPQRPLWPAEQLKRNLCSYGTMSWTSSGVSELHASHL